MEKITLIFASGRPPPVWRPCCWQSFCWVSDFLINHVWTPSFFESLVGKNIAKETDSNVINQLIKQRKEYTPAAFFNFSDDQLCYDLHSGCRYLLKFPLMFPLSVARVERLFSKIKLIKTRLRNQLGRLSLDSLLHISAEAPEKFQDDKYEFFVHERKRLNPNQRIKLQTI